MENNYYVYILTSKRNGTLYIGVTNNLERRIFEHKNNTIKGFTEKYKVHMLVYFEQTNNIESAIQREKQLKKWNRKWKLDLIERNNPNWNDLSSDWIPNQVGNDRGKDIVAKQGGQVAGNARKELEDKSGQKVVTGKNFLEKSKAKNRFTLN